MSNGLAGGALLPASDHAGASSSMASDVWGATATHSDRGPHTGWIYWPSLDYKLQRITGTFLLFSCFPSQENIMCLQKVCKVCIFLFNFIVHVNKPIIKRIYAVFLYYSTQFQCII